MSDSMITKTAFVNVLTSEGIRIKATPMVKSPKDMVTESGLSVYVTMRSIQPTSKTPFITDE
jgi:hypothetical protein